MPICPRCGKTLSTQQALEYHLQKKNKCGSIKCKICDQSFDTKLSLQMHCLKCEGNSQLNYEEGLRVCHSLEIFRADNNKKITWKSKSLITYQDDYLISHSNKLIDNIYQLVPQNFSMVASSAATAATAA